MIKILFVCHGNICRSPMAEMILKDMTKKKNIAAHFDISSAATSLEEIGNGVHPGTRKKLAMEGIMCEMHKAVQVTKHDLQYYDYLIVMDSNNLRNLLRLLGEEAAGKTYRLLDFTARKGQDIADPWYTGDFNRTYEDIAEGCQGLLEYLGF